MFLVNHSQNMPESTLECPFCRANNSLPKSMIRNHKLYRCLNCDLQFFHPRVYDFAAYEENKVGGIYSEYHGLRSEPTMWIKTIVRELKKMRYDFAGKTVLEVGAGDALNFAYLKTAMGLDDAQYTMLESDKLSIEAAKKRGRIKIITGFFDNEFANNHLAEYDIVLLTEVIEHQVEITDFIDNLFLMLKPGGKLILTTPNADRPLIFIGSRTDSPPHHFLRFTKSFFFKNYSNQIASYRHYFFDFDTMVSYSKAVSKSKLKYPNFFLLFLPIFLAKHAMSLVLRQGEGHLVFLVKPLTSH